MDERELEEQGVYEAVRFGVRDAIWDVLEVVIAVVVTVMLLGLGVPLTIVGVRGGIGVPSLLTAGVGIVLIALAFRLFLRQFGLWPFEW